MSRKISKKYRRNQTDETLRPATFSEFLEYYVNPNERQNEHWISFASLAQPCMYKYTYILKLEDIEFESNWLFRHLKVNMTYPKGYNRPDDKHSRTKSYLKNIDKKLLGSVYDKEGVDSSVEISQQ